MDRRQVATLRTVTRVTLQIVGRAFDPAGDIRAGPRSSARFWGLRERA